MSTIDLVQTILIAALTVVAIGPLYNMHKTIQSMEAHDKTFDAFERLIDALMAEIDHISHDIDEIDANIDNIKLATVGIDNEKE